MFPFSGFKLGPKDRNNRGNGDKTRQSSLLYVFVRFFGFDPAQNTIVVYSELRD